MKNIWVPLSGAISQQRKVETLANNIANANTPGFKRDSLVFKEYLTAFEKGTDDITIPRGEFAPKDFYHSQGSQNAYVEVDGQYTDYGQGQLTPTGNPLDIAVQGKAFFEVLTPGGIRYTRKGNFSLNREGQLVTDQGHPILAALDPKQLQDTNAKIDPKDRIITFNTSQNISVNLQGDVFSGNNKISTLSLVEFKDPQYLQKIGSSLYINKDNKNINTETTSATVRQGFVEQSNVNVVLEMSELMKANRHFESIQKVIKTYDAMSSKGVNDISRF